MGHSRRWQRLLSLALVAGFVLGCDGSNKGTGGTTKFGKLLEGPEIQALFEDKTVEGHHEIHGYDFRSYYDKDGTFRSHQSDKKGPRKATWEVRGNDICVKWEDPTPDDKADELCRRMAKDDDGTYRKVKIRGGGKGPLVVVTFKSFKPGNPDNL